jgi:copper chaperone
MEERVTIQLAIEGMHCGACVRRLTAALARLEGVEVRAVEVGSAEVDAAPGSVEAQEIADAVSAIGFPARAV